MKKINKYFAVLGLVILMMPLQIFPDDNPQNHILIFQFSDYDSKVRDVVKYFFSHGLTLKDNLSILTPVQPYSFSQSTLRSKTARELIERTQKVLKRDIAAAATNDKSIFDAMVSNIQEINAIAGKRISSVEVYTKSSDLRNLLIQYRQLLSNYHSIRKIQPKILLDLASALKQSDNPSSIYLFFQQEFRPIPGALSMDYLMQNTELKFYAVELFQEEKEKENPQVEQVIQEFKSLPVIFHFIYVKKATKSYREISMKEHSIDMYSAFSKIAEATGGTITTTTQPKETLKSILDSRDRE